MIWHNAIFAESISDVDNLDRYDVYHIYDSLWYEEFSNKSNTDKIKYYQDQIKRIKNNESVSLATALAIRTFHKELALPEIFYEHLLQQMRRSI